MERKAREQKALDFSDPAAVLDMAKKWYDTQVEKERLKMQNELQQKELKEAAPKVQYHDDVIQSHSTHSINVIAKELGMSAIRLNKMLQAMRVQYKQGGQWLLYAKHQNKGYTKTRTTTFTDSRGEPRTNVYTVWTGRGRKFIHEKVAAYKAANK
jgi:anti-repressor protein